MDPEYTPFNMITTTKIILIFYNLSGFVPFLDVDPEPWTQPPHHHSNGEYCSYFSLFLFAYFIYLDRDPAP
jgi:hypothetical protein